MMDGVALDVSTYERVFCVEPVSNRFRDTAVSSRTEWMPVLSFIYPHVWSALTCIRSHFSCPLHVYVLCMLWFVVQFKLKTLSVQTVYQFDTEKQHSKSGIVNQINT